MYFILRLSCLVLSLDSSACLGNNTLPDIYNHIFIPPKTNDENFINIEKLPGNTHSYKYLK